MWSSEKVDGEITIEISRKKKQNRKLQISMETLVKFDPKTWTGHFNILKCHLNTINKCVFQLLSLWNGKRSILSDWNEKNYNFCFTFHWKVFRREKVRNMKNSDICKLKIDFRCWFLHFTNTQKEKPFFYFWQFITWIKSGLKLIWSVTWISF